MYKVVLLVALVSVGCARRRNRNKVVLCPHQDAPMEESMYLLPAMAERTPVRKSPFRTSILTGNRTCPPHDVEGHMCPWYFQMNYDPDREPSFIVEASCKCQRCRYEGGGKCEGVTVPRTVLRRRPGRRCMSWVVERFTVACACRLSRRTHAQKGPP